MAATTTAVVTFLSLYGSTIATGLSVAGAVASTTTSLVQASQQRSAASAQARALRRQAGIERVQAEVEAGQRRRAAIRAIGGRRAGFATSGVGISGSALDVLADVAFEEELGVALTRSFGQERASVLETESRLRRRAGRQEATSSTLGGISTGLSGLGQTLLSLK